MPPDPGLALILAKRMGAGKKSGVGAGPDAAGDGDDKGAQMKSSAMSDFIDAVKGGDVDGAMSALDDYNDLCDQDDEPDGDEGGDEMDSDIGSPPDAAA